VTATADKLADLLEAELRQPVPPAVSELAAQLAERGGAHTAAVLFYGSALRTSALDGVLDYYVLLDRVSAWPASLASRVANRLLPPNVGYIEAEAVGHTLRAKYAVMSVTQFRKRMSLRSLDTTLWARFSQPCVCVWVRSDADRRALLHAIRSAVVTAAQWAAMLGPVSGTAVDFWRALFARTYGAELRVENQQRSADIVARDQARYATYLPLAWQAAVIDYASTAEHLTPQINPAQRRTALRRWSRRQRLGKPLNLLRLSKAAFTFDGAMDYVAWKIERHSGVHIDIAPWQRRFPLLAAPGLYWRLRKRGVLR
jgi:hypothetical protein